MISGREQGPAGWLRACRRLQGASSLSRSQTFPGIQLPPRRHAGLPLSFPPGTPASSPPGLFCSQRPHLPGSEPHPRLCCPLPSPPWWGSCYLLCLSEVHPPLSTLLLLPAPREGGLAGQGVTFGATQQEKLHQARAACTSVGAAVLLFTEFHTALVINAPCPGAGGADQGPRGSVFHT